MTQSFFMRFFLIVFLCLFLVGCNTGAPSSKVTATATPSGGTPDDSSTPEESSAADDLANFDKLDDEARQKAFEQLQDSAISTRTQNHLIDIMGNRKEKERWRLEAARALLTIEDPELVLDYFEVWKDPGASAKFKKTVAAPVAAAAKTHEEIRDFVLESLKDKDQTELHAALVPCLVGIDDEQIVSRLRTFYGNPSTPLELRESAIRTLASLAGDKEVENVLRAAAVDREISIRKALVEGLKECGTAACRPYLEQMSQNNHPEVMEAAQEALREIGK